MGREARARMEREERMQGKLLIAVFADEGGRLQVQGPLHDKIACLGLLEAAKSLVIQHQANEVPRILPATMVPIPPNGGIR